MFATIDGVELPCHFKYQPLIPEKRVRTKKTAKGLIIQKSNVPIMQNGTFDFELTRITQEYLDLFCKIYEEDSNTPFTGYWGESYLLEITDLNVTVNAGIHTITGTAVVGCIMSSYCKGNIGC